MSERLLSTEAVASPERLGGYTEYEALQARLLADILDPDYRFTRLLTSADTIPFERRSYSALDTASTSERRTYWQSKAPELSTDKQYDSWRQSTLKAVRRTEVRERIAVLSRLQRIAGIDFTSLDEAALDKVYARYCENSDSREYTLSDSRTIKVSSDIKIFVGDIIASYMTAGGEIDMISLERDLPAYQWFARIFGHNSSEIIAQLIHAETRRIVDEQTLLNKVAQKDGSGDMRINRLGQRERELLQFLHQYSGKTKVEIAPTKPDPTTPTARSTVTKVRMPDMWHYEEAGTDTETHFPGADYVDIVQDAHQLAEIHRALKTLTSRGKTPEELEALIAQGLKRSRELERRDAPVLESVKTSLRRYERILKSKYDIKPAMSLDDITIMHASPEVVAIFFNGSKSLACSFVLRGVPTIFINSEMLPLRIEQLRNEERRLGRHPSDEELYKIAMEELILHEYTHLIADKAFWYRSDEKEKPHNERIYVSGRSGLGIGSPDNKTGRVLGRIFPGVIRGEALNEAVTDRLSTRFFFPDSHEPSYRAESEVLDDLLCRLVKIGCARNTEEAFTYFVKAYFSKADFRKLAEMFEGKRIDTPREYPHYLEIVYALMDVEWGGDYKLTRAFVQRGSFSETQKQNLREVLRKHFVYGSSVRISPRIIRELNETYGLGFNITGIFPRDRIRQPASGSAPGEAPLTAGVTSGETPTPGGLPALNEAPVLGESPAPGGSLTPGETPSRTESTSGEMSDSAESSEYARSSTESPRSPEDALIDYSDFRGLTPEQQVEIIKEFKKLADEAKELKNFERDAQLWMFALERRLANPDEPLEKILADFQEYKKNRFSRFVARMRGRQRPDAGHTPSTEPSSHPTAQSSFFKKGIFAEGRYFSYVPKLPIIFYDMLRGIFRRK